MTLPIRGRHVLRGLAFASVAAAGYMFGVSSDSADAQQPQPGVPPVAAQPQPQQQLPKQPLPEQDRRVVGYITSNNTLIPITREELGDYLIARGGHEKLELFANRKILELEAQRRGITVSTAEVKAKLEEMLRPLGVNMKDFEEKILNQKGKTLYEYVEDIVKPELMMTKLCSDRVKVTDEDIQKSFENLYGERRAAKIICWSRTDQKIALRQWEEARKSDADFDRLASQQADSNLAAACGKIKPVGRHLENGNDKKVVETLFTLKPGEMSGIIEVPSGLMCIKCTAILPPEKDAKLDEKLKSTLYKELFDRRLQAEFPKYFKELRDAAKLQLLLKGPPSAAEYREGVRNIVNQATGAAPR